MSNEVVTCGRCHCLVAKDHYDEHRAWHREQHIQMGLMLAELKPKPVNRAERRAR